MKKTEGFQSKSRLECTLPLKRVIKNFDWVDSFRKLFPDRKLFSRYYDNLQHGEGASKIDRSYHYGGIEIIDAKYIGVAFSDHFSLIITIKVPENFFRFLTELFKKSPLR